MAECDVAETREYLSPPPAHNAKFRPFKAAAAHNFEPYVDVGLKGKGVESCTFHFIYLAFFVQHGAAIRTASVSAVLKASGDERTIRKDGASSIWIVARNGYLSVTTRTACFLRWRSDQLRE